jgi:hypothetical protein
MHDVRLLQPCSEIVMYVPREIVGSYYAATLAENNRPMSWMHESRCGASKTAVPTGPYSSP